MHFSHDAHDGGAGGAAEVEACEEDDGSAHRAADAAGGGRESGRLGASSLGFKEAAGFGAVSRFLGADESPRG